MNDLLSTITDLLANAFIYTTEFAPVLVEQLALQNLWTGIWALVVAAILFVAPTLFFLIKRKSFGVVSLPVLLSCFFILGSVSLLIVEEGLGKILLYSTPELAFFQEFIK